MAENTKKPTRIKSIITKGKTVYAKKPASEKELSPQQEKFVENIASGKNQTDSYQDAYPNSSRPAARNNAARLLAKDSIAEAVDRRKQLAAQHAKVTDAQVMGATAEIAFASIEDAFDAHGYFDYKKAVKTRAVSLIKKISRTKGKFGENVSVEFYSKKDALDRLGDYLGMKQSDRPNSDELVMLKQIIEQSAERSGISYTDELHYFAENFAGIYKPDLVKQLVSEMEN